MHDGCCQSTGLQCCPTSCGMGSGCTLWRQHDMNSGRHSCNAMRLSHTRALSPPAHFAA